MKNIIFQIRSTRGVGPLASKDARFKDKILMRTPSPTRYNVDYKKAVKKNDNIPFGSKSRRIAIIENKFPGFDKSRTYTYMYIALMF